MIIAAEETKPKLEAPAAKSETLKVLTYNVLADEVNAGQRVLALFKILKESDADIIVLQEVAPWFFRKMHEEPWLKNYHLIAGDGSNAVRGEYAILGKDKPLNEGKKDAFPSDHFGLTATLKFRAAEKK